MNVKGVGLFGVLVQTVLYGIYFTLTVISMYCMYWTRGKTVSPNKVVMGFSAALFLAITLFCTLGVVRVVHALVLGEDDPVDSLVDLLQNNALMVARYGAFFSMNFFVDCLLTYRLYMIYLQSWQIVALPVPLMMVYFGSAISQLAVISREPDRDNNSKIRVTASVNVAISIFLCTYSTVLISYRIMRDGRAFRHFGTRNTLGPALYIIVEGAFVYTTLNLLLLALYLANVKGDYYLIFVFVVPPLIVRLFPFPSAPLNTVRSSDGSFPYQGINNTLALIYTGLGVTSAPRPQITTPTLRYSVRSQMTVALNRSEHVVALVVDDLAEEGEWVDGNGTLGQTAGKRGDELQVKNGTAVLNRSDD